MPQRAQLSQNVALAIGARCQSFKTRLDLDQKLSASFENFKKDPTSEIFGALGYLAKVDLFKKTKESFDHLLTPKMLVRLAPNHMRKESDGARINHLNIFSLDRLSSNNNFEGGISGS